MRFPKTVFFLFCSLIFVHNIVQSQPTTGAVNVPNTTGSWYGKAYMNLGSGSNNYLMELQIKQKGNDVSGIIGYYFRDQYHSFYVFGTYTPATRQLFIKNVPLVYYRSTETFTIDCPMNLSLTLLQSKTGKSMKGYLYSQETYKNTCGDLSVQFTVDPLDFSYDSTFKAGFSYSRVWKPSPEDFIISSAVVAQKKTPAFTSGDSLVKKTVEEINTVEVLKKIEEEQLTNLLKSRKSILSEEVEFEGDSIRISLYDNGEVDGDSVAIFLNGKTVIPAALLSSRAQTIYLSIEEELPYYEISMMALNLGLFPPNTALMVVSDGKKTKEVYMSSNLTQNAVLRIKKKKKIN